MLNQNFKDMLSALNDAGVEYLVVGGYALAAHGCPRATGDIDFWVHATTENAERTWKALSAFGAPMSRLTVDDLVSPDVVFQIGVAPQRIDVLTSITGVLFSDAWPQRFVTEVDGLQVNIIGRQELIQTKQLPAEGR